MEISVSIVLLSTGLGAALVAAVWAVRLIHAYGQYRPRRRHARPEPQVEAEPVCTCERGWTSEPGGVVPGCPVHDGDSENRSQPG